MTRTGLGEVGGRKKERKGKKEKEKRAKRKAIEKEGKKKELGRCPYKYISSGTVQPLNEAHTDEKEKHSDERPPR